MMRQRGDIRVVVFDTFGTLVDWRTGVSAAVTRVLGDAVDPERFADSWRSLYQPSMEPVRSGLRPYTHLDVLLRETLGETLISFGLDADVLGPASQVRLVKAWSELQPWPDVLPGLQQVRQTHLVAPLSNATTRMLIDMSRSAKLSWDMIIGSDLARTYKPNPDAYAIAADPFNVTPEEVMLVAAHNDDLEGARAAGLRTGFLARPREHGPSQTHDLKPSGDWDVVADSMTDLASQLTR